METIFDGCVPRDEVLKGELRDEMFAARLKDVVEEYPFRTLLGWPTHPMVRQTRRSSGRPPRYGPFRGEGAGGGRTSKPSTPAYSRNACPTAARRGSIPQSWIRRSRSSAPIQSV